jgi:hypothetical protein
MSRLSCKHFFVVSAVILALSGCATLPPATLGHLATFDPLTADASQLSVAILLPDTFLLRDGDIVMNLKMVAQAQAMQVDQSFPLQIDTEAAAASTLPVPQAGQRLEVARVTPSDLGRLAKLQQLALSTKLNQDKKGSGAISVGLQGGCRTQDLGSEPLIAAIYLKTDDSGYYPLVRKLDMRQSFGNAVLAKIAPCKA